MCASPRRPSCDGEVRRATVSVYVVRASWVSRVHLFVPLGKRLYQADTWIGHAEALGGRGIGEVVSVELSLGASIELIS